MKAKRMVSTGALVAAVAVIGASTAQAQASANVTASATVAAALSYAVNANLAFGQVIPGFNKTVATADAGAGQVEFTGGVGAQVQISFTALPANLTSGANNLPIAYTAATAATAAGAQTGFAPAAGTLVNLDATTGKVFVFVGGTVSPGGVQAAGAYSGTITVQAAYTGL